MRDDGITNGPTSGYRWLNSAGFAVSRESGSSTSSAQRTNSRCTNGGDGDSVGVAKDDDVEGVEEEGEGESGAGTVRWTHLSVDAGDWSRAEHALAALEKETGHQKKEQEEDQRRKVGGA